ncbi:hypothetical protein KUW18_12470 [Halomonas sp. DP5Y7-2]|uniref:hypothetical protein n=1 Tax=Halomonas sp. DP5Y7-2 TaxID=2859076 RepID=UPI001C99AABA|nr:hypothetical protein [Halomonas sp. DP5Y7-2]MBY5984901.1 hypothetical protein [Halomonas sp. DP5Y7-2]
MPDNLPGPRSGHPMLLLTGSRLKLIMTLAIAAIIAVSWLGILDRATQRQVEGATTQALLAFAAARGLNAGISVLQSTEVGVVAASTHPFEVLDPINDLVEDYASVMKLAIGSLIGQTLLLEITATLAFKVAFTAAGLWLLLSLWRGWPTTALAWRAFALIGLGRFLLLLTLAASALVDHAFLDERTTNSMEEVQRLSEDVQATSEAHTDDGLPAEQRERIERELASAEDQRDQLRGGLITLNRRIALAEQGVEQSRGRLSLLTARLSLKERLNPFHDNPEIDRLQQQLAERRDSLAALTEQREHQLKQLAELDRRRDALSSRLAGEDQGLLASLSQRFSALTDSLSLAAIQSRVESGTNAILELMALFVLRTLVIPLLFLWLGMKLFRALYARPPQPLPMLPAPGTDRDQDDRR